MKKIDVDKDILYDLYINKRLSTSEIAKILNIGKNTVNRHLRRYDIEIRSKESAQKESMKRLSKKIREANIDSNMDCKHCGKKIYVKPCLVDRAVNHFCSSKCAALYYSVKREKRGIYSSCDCCGEPIYNNKYLYNLLEHHFCSQKCYGKWRAKTFIGPNHIHYKRIETKCSNCGKTLLLIPSTYNRSKNYHYCNAKCMAEHYETGIFGGENNPNWKGGYDNVYYGPIWNKTRRQVRVRDNYICQRCGMTEKELGKAMSVHHKIPIRLFSSWKEANVLSNLISLCPKCHGIVEYHGIDFEINKDIVQTTTSI